MAAVVVVNGWYRTGSTVCFYAVQRLLAAAGLPFRSGGQDLAPADRMIAEHLARPGNEWLVLKSHHWLPSPENQDRVVSLYTRRHPADIMRSGLELTRRRFAAAGRSQEQADAEALQQGVPGLAWLLTFYRYVLPRLPLHVIDYETFYGQPRALAEHLAGLLGLTLDAGRLDTVAADLDVARIKRWTDSLEEPWDPQSHFRQFAVSQSLGRPNGSFDGLPEVYRSLIEQADLSQATT